MVCNSPHTTCVDKAQVIACSDAVACKKALPKATGFFLVLRGCCCLLPCVGIAGTKYPELTNELVKHLREEGHKEEQVR